MLDLDIYSIFIHCIDWVEKKNNRKHIGCLAVFFMRKRTLDYFAKCSFTSSL